MARRFDDDGRVRRILTVVVSVGVIALVVWVAFLQPDDDDAPIEGADWQLEELLLDGAMQPVIPGSAVVLRLDDGELSGDGGCNGYAGTYEVSGSSLTMPPIAATLTLCDQPPGASDQESNYLALLRTVDSFELGDDDRLVLASNGTTTLVFGSA